jgi:hypothetical protein
MILIANHLEVDPWNRRPHPCEEESKLGDRGIGD